jgi:redox-sensing transcriptional repressor
MKPVSIPIPTLYRLPVYYHCLKAAIQEDEEYVSSVELGQVAGATPEQVRKDLSFLEGQGRSRVGYDAVKLATTIEDYLGLMNDKEAVLVGAGNLGRALALYDFSRFGLKIVILFDKDPQKIGTKVGDLHVLPVEKLGNLVRRMRIRIGIVTTPPGSAQQVADEMVANGIKAIWNFSTLRLKVPADVMVRHVDLSSELVVISQYIKSLGLHNQDGSLIYKNDKSLTDHLNEMMLDDSQSSVEEEQVN